jgi:hypothetical protein
MSMDGTNELADLRRVFPGIWTRDDGSFLLEKPFGMKWSRSKDFVTFMAADYGKNPVELTVEQCQAIANYIRAFAAPASDYTAPWMYGAQFAPEEIYGHKQANAEPLEFNKLPLTSKGDA